MHLASGAIKSHYLGCHSRQLTRNDLTENTTIRYATATRPRRQQTTYPSLDPNNKPTRYGINSNP